MRLARRPVFRSDVKRALRQAVREMSPASAKKLSDALDRASHLLLDIPTLGRSHTCPAGRFQSLSVPPFDHLRILFEADDEEVRLVRLVDSRRAPGTYGSFEEEGG